MSPVTNPSYTEPRRDLRSLAKKFVVNNDFCSYLAQISAPKTWYFQTDFDHFLTFSSLLYGKNDLQTGLI